MACKCFGNNNMISTTACFQISRTNTKWQVVFHNNEMQTDHKESDFNLAIYAKFRIGIYYNSKWKLFNMECIDIHMLVSQKSVCINYIPQYV